MEGGDLAFAGGEGGGVGGKECEALVDEGGELVVGEGLDVGLEVFGEVLVGVAPAVALGSCGG